MDCCRWAGSCSLAKSLDTLGFYTHTAADMLAFWESIGQPIGRPETFAFAAPSPMLEVDAPMATAFQNALTLLRNSGMTIKSIDIAAMLTKLYAANRTIMYYEGARFHEQRFKQYGARLLDLADLVRDGLLIPAAEYDQAMRYADQCKKTFAAIYKDTPVILVPAAPGRRRQVSPRLEIPE